MRVPSVTEILKLCGLSDFSHVEPEVLERKRQLGLAVHEWTEWLDEGRVSYRDTPAAEIAGYVDAYLRFRNEAAFEVSATEQVVVNEKYRYAGTLDRAGYFRASSTPNELAVLDLKCVAQVSPATRLQVAGYSLASGIKGRASLQLRADGTYRLARYRDDHDLQDWLSCVRVAAFKLRHGMAHQED